ncbi:MAG: biopolymer transporter ExbD [Syntrophales bacterium LBB04]|nr:biopolymer transporter ExbD [Syntrophales bacterium LBB04]
MEEKEFNSINVIPLVDVMLVLLTIVLTTSSFMVTGMIPVELPRATNVQQETLKTQVIEIDRQGNIYLNSRPLSLRDLRDAMGLLNRIVPVLIRADRSLPLQGFVDVLDLVKTLGFQRVSLCTEGRQ